MTPNMPSSGRVDVLQVLSHAATCVRPGISDEHAAWHRQLVEARAAVAELIEADKRWQAVRKYASGDDFDRWEEMARGGHIPSDDGNRYADLRADALANIGAAP